MFTGESTHHRIVVGIDGSACSKQALQWAVGLAELTHLGVLVVAAWHWPTAFVWGASMEPPYSPAEDAEAILVDMLEPLRKEHPDVGIESVVIEGHPAPVLIKTSQGADLLVVGSRGHGEFVGMLIGSVSEHCVSHASCPVVVWRG